MSKESFERGLGKLLKPPKRQAPFRPGKTQRDKVNGAWGNRITNLIARGDASRGGPQRKGKRS